MIGCAGFDEFLRESGDPGSEPTNPDFLRHIAVCPACLATFVSYSRAAEMARAAYDPRDEGMTSLAESRVHAILDAVRADPGETTASFDVA